MLFSLVLAYFPRALMGVARVSKYGLDKYKANPSDKGFLLMPDARRRLTDSLVRHLVKEETEGLINHEDGGLEHDLQVAWNALARVEKRLIDEEEAVRFSPGFIEALAQIKDGEPRTEEFIGAIDVVS